MKHLETIPSAAPKAKDPSALEEDGALESSGCFSIVFNMQMVPEEPSDAVPGGSALMNPAEPVAAAVTDEGGKPQFNGPLEPPVTPMLHVGKPVERHAVSSQGVVLGALPTLDGSSLSSPPRAPAMMRADPVPTTPLKNDGAVRFEELVEQFDRRLLSMVQRNEKVMRITMRPAALGRLTVCFREENSTMVLEIYSQNNAVRELVAQHEDAIRRLMQEHGIELGGFDVFMGDGRDESRGFWPEPFAGEGDSSGIAPASEGSGESCELIHAPSNGAVSWVA